MRRRTAWNVVTIITYPAWHSCLVGTPSEVPKFNDFSDNFVSNNSQADTEDLGWPYCVKTEAEF